MKNYIQSTLSKGVLALLSLLLLCSVTSCEDVNSINQKYFDKGMLIYTGAVDSLQVFPGYERALLTWQINADPRITRTVIFWNQRADSVVVPVNRTQSGFFKMSQTLTGLLEKDHVFEVITRDNEGHFSMTQEIVTSIFGENYAKQLRSRAIFFIERRSNGDMIIQWEPISSLDIQFSTVTYMQNGAEKSVQVSNSDLTTTLTGLSTGDVISVTTSFRPANALEPIASFPREYTLPASVEVELNKANFSALVLEGDNTSVNQNRPLSNIWDGGIANPAILHTVQDTPGFNYPHYFTFDIGIPAAITRFRVWPRTENNMYSGNSLRTFEVWATESLKASPTDEIYWTSDAWKADWTMLHDCEIVNDGILDNWRVQGFEYPADQSAGVVRYIRLIIKSNWNGLNVVNIGEITLWGFM